jgi:AraC-like DNA-binding protein
MNLEGLIELASRHERGQVVRPVDGLVLVRQEIPSALEASLYEPVLCLILQGRKQVAIGGETLAFGPGECLLVSHDLPVRSRVTSAPYLALVLRVDAGTIRKLRDEVAAPALDGERPRAAVTHRADPGLLDALRRYLALVESPSDAKVLRPLISQEIHYRLLAAPFGAMLRRLVDSDSHASAVARAIGHIRGDIRSSIAIPVLARRVGMSASSFHKHFKTITSTTPRQYQKELRLLEARRLLKTGGVSVTTAAYEVGYESASQFSREYARKFRVPPRHDTAVRAVSATARSGRTARPAPAGRSNTRPTPRA